MGESIDRIAQAACEAGFHVWPTTDGYNDRAEKEAWRKIARATLKAVRQPSPLMLAFGWAALNKGRVTPVPLAPGPALREAFPAMIDAVLNAP